MATKPTAVSVNEELQALKALVAEMAKNIEALEVSNVQMRAELLEVRATKAVASKPVAKPTEAKQDEAGVYTFVPPSANVTAVSSLSNDKVKIDGNIVSCTPAVWAYWRTQLERKAKAA